MKKKHRVFIVEDHPIMREGLVQTIEQEEDLEVCGEAEDVNGAYKATGEGQPDLVIVDISLKGGNGLDLVKMLKKRNPDIHILVLSMYEENIYAGRAIRAGAQGYIMKYEETEEFLRAVRQVLMGKIYMSEEMYQKVAHQTLQRGKEVSSPIDLLSDRELEVLELIGQGRSTKEIAEKLFLSVKTVDSYRERIKEKLQIKTAQELLFFAFHWRENSR